MGSQGPDIEDAPNKGLKGILLSGIETFCRSCVCRGEGKCVCESWVVKRGVVLYLTRKVKEGTLHRGKVLKGRTVSQWEVTCLHMTWDGCRLRREATKLTGATRV